VVKKNQFNQFKNSKYMTTSALIMMVLSKGTIAGFTFYFFGKMLSMPIKPQEQEEEHNYPRGG
jgi:hypothetical protein